MREFTVAKNDAGQRLDRFLLKAIPLLPAPLAQKYIRIKRIKVNGKKSDKAYKLQVDDVLQLYINDEFFEKPHRENAYLLITNPDLNIVYEDDNILLVDKKPGVLCHSGGEDTHNTLIDNIRAYLYQSGAWKPREELSFAPALCNRIDRNTSGLVIAAKNAEALKILSAKIRNREIDKYYVCIVHGIPSPPSGTLSGYLFKDKTQNRSYMRKTNEAAAKTAVTEYRTLAVSDDLALLECKIITGRSHQIRAGMADMGHPLLGDKKYGSKGTAEKHQALYSYRVKFSFTEDAGILNYLKGEEFTVKNTDFIKKYFNYRF